MAAKVACIMYEHGTHAFADSPAHMSRKVAHTHTHMHRRRGAFAARGKRCHLLSCGPGARRAAGPQLTYGAEPQLSTEGVGTEDVRTVRSQSMMWWVSHSVRSESRVACGRDATLPQCRGTLACAAVFVCRPYERLRQREPEARICRLADGLGRSRRRTSHTVKTGRGWSTHKLFGASVALVVAIVVLSGCAHGQTRGSGSGLQHPMRRCDVDRRRRVCKHVWRHRRVQSVGGRHR